MRGVSTMSRAFSGGNSTSFHTSARRRPSVATHVSFPSAKESRRPVRTGLESSVAAAYAVLRIMPFSTAWSSVYASPLSVLGMAGNSFGEMPVIFEWYDPQDMRTRSVCSPESHEMVTIWSESSRTIDVRRFTGSVVAPGSSISALHVQRFVIVKSVVVNVSVSPSASMRTLERTGSVGRLPTTPCTAFRASRRFDWWSLNFMVVYIRCSGNLVFRISKGDPTVLATTRRNLENRLNFNGKSCS